MFAALVAGLVVAGSYVVVAAASENVPDAQASIDTAGGTNAASAGRDAGASASSASTGGRQAEPGYPLPAADPALNYMSSPSKAFRYGFRAYKRGDTEDAIEALAFAAERGHPAALWKLGRMYQTGDGVARDDARAFDLFRRIADEQANGNPKAPDARYAASAFVALGEYYVDGFPGMQANEAVARSYFGHAASYYGDPDAQYRLAAMYLLGQGGPKDVTQAARWFKLAAQKGHAGAQAEFGRLLIEGSSGFSRNPVVGLMWLTIASSGEVDDPHIRSLHDQALGLVTKKQADRAVSLARQWQDAHRQR